MVEKASNLVLGLLLFQFFALGCLVYLVVDTRSQLAALQDETSNPYDGIEHNSPIRMLRQADSSVSAKLREAMSAWLDEQEANEQKMTCCEADGRCNSANLSTENRGHIQLQLGWKQWREVWTSNWAPGSKGGERQKRKERSKRAVW